jgi:hypothetical protein
MAAQVVASRAVLSSTELVSYIFHKSAIYNYVPSSFKMNGRNIQFKHAAGVFNEYFFNVADNLQTHTNNIFSPIELLKNANQTVFFKYGSNPCNQRRNN